VTAARFAFRLRGEGRVEVAAYGLADAEHRVEKELGALFPAARVEVTEVARAGEGRIVEELVVRYRVSLAAEGEGESAAEARRAALAPLRAAAAGTRFERIAWSFLEEGER
jgi:hypothetical protein